MLEFLGQAALRTLLLAAVVQLGLGLLRIKRPQLRLTAWTVVLAASLAMPALQWAPTPTVCIAERSRRSLHRGCRPSAASVRVSSVHASTR